MQPDCRLEVKLLDRPGRVELKVLVNVAEAAVTAVELCLQAFGNVAAVMMIAPLDEGGVANLQLLLVD